MKLSELIEVLNKAKSEFGDVRVMIEAIRADYSEMDFTGAFEKGFYAGEVVFIGVEEV